MWQPASHDVGIGGSPKSPDALYCSHALDSLRLSRTLATAILLVSCNATLMTNECDILCKKLLILNYSSRFLISVFFEEVCIRVSDVYRIRYSYRYPSNIDN